MQRIFFILGRDPELSSAEISSFLNKKNVNFHTDIYFREVMVVSLEKDIDLENVMKNLGGVVKAGIILDEVKYEESEDEFDRVLSAENLLKNYFTGTKNKIHFGISIYQTAENNPYVAQLIKRQKDLNQQIKDNLTKSGKSAGFVQIKERTLSSVSVLKNGLLANGAEIILIVADKSILIGKTVAVQEFSSFSFRDYYRPAKDLRSGIMPPKLARMMINLSGIDTLGSFLDPFCGSGTLVQEAILLGIRKVTGTDISDRAISDTMRNIDWIFTHYRDLDRKYYDLSIKKVDVKRIEKFIASNSIDAIVTEPFLGPPLRSRPDSGAIRNIFSNLKPLYLEAFQKFSRIVKPGGSIVLIFPAFESGEKIISMDIHEDILAMGFEQVKLSDGDKYSILVGDKYSYLKREIFKFIRK